MNWVDNPLNCGNSMAVDYLERQISSIEVTVIIMILLRDL